MANFIDISGLLLLFLYLRWMHLKPTHTVFNELLGAFNELTEVLANLETVTDVDNTSSTPETLQKLEQANLTAANILKNSKDLLDAVHQYEGSSEDNYDPANPPHSQDHIFRTRHQCEQVAADIEDVTDKIAARVIDMQKNLLTGRDSQHDTASKKARRGITSEQTRPRRVRFAVEIETWN